MEPEISDTDWTIQIIIALLLILLPLLYYIIKNKKKGRIILLVGPSECGKTTIFLNLLNKKCHNNTVISIIPNESEYKINNKQSLILKDLPGHERVRNKWWELNKNGLRGIICIVDSAGGNKSIRETCEVLYNILIDNTINSVKPKILIFGNKLDLPMAKNINIIKSQIEKEMTTLRLTKSASLQTTEGTNVSTRILGKMDRDFEFNHISHIQVEFAEGSCQGENIDLSIITKWLENLA